MTTSISRMRSAFGLGATMVTIAGGLTLAVSPLSGAVNQAGVQAPAAAHVRAASAATVVHAAGVPGATGQGPVTSSCVSSAGRTACDIWARAGVATVHNGVSTTVALPVWSFSASGTAPVNGASAVLVGKVGEPIDITLHNTLTSNVGLSLPQSDNFVADTTGIAAGASKTYTFTPQRPGTYLYQAALTPDGSRQVAMGLVGALVVRPATAPTQGYDDPSTAFDDEAVLVYTDVDSHLAADPTGFNMRDYRPDYHLVNGAAYPDLPAISTGRGRSLILRMVNGSILDKAPTLSGGYWNVVGDGARPLAAVQVTSGRNITAGDTVDAIMTMPSDADTRIAIYDAPGNLGNGGWINGANSPAIGGGLVLVQSGGVVGTTPTGPLGTSLTAAGQPGGVGRPLTITGTFDTTGRGAGSITEAEYLIDSASAVAGTGTPITGMSVGATTVTASWQVDASALSSGAHTIYARARDAFGTWGPLKTVVVKVDNTGPDSTGITTTANPINGSSALPIDGTVDDTNQGGSSSVAAQAWIDGTAIAPTTIIPLTTNGPRVVAAATGSIPAAQLTGLSEGSHTLYVQGKDVLNQWGAATGSTFKIDRTAPTTNSVTLTPNLTNVLTGNPAKPTVVTVVADLADPVSGGVNSPISRADIWIGGSRVGQSIGMTQVNTGTIPAGVTRMTGDIPLSALAGYTGTQSLPIWVTATDAAGNQGTGASANLQIDRNPPTISGTITQGVGIGNDTTATVTATLTDGVAAAASGVASAEWFIGADPGIGKANRLTLTPGPNGTFTTSTPVNLVTYNLISGGTMTWFVRVNDNAGNSGMYNVKLAMRPQLYFEDGFESDFTPWTSRNPAAGANPAITTVTPIAGTKSLSVNAGSITAGAAATANAATISAANSALVQKTLTPNPAVGNHIFTKFAMTPTSLITGCTTGTATATCTPNGVTVYSGNTTAGGSAVLVQYGRAAANTAVRFRVGIATGGTTAAPTITWGAWRTITTAASYAISVDWNGGTAATTTLTVNGTAITQAGNTSAFTVNAINLGVMNRIAADTGTVLFDTVGSARAPY